MLVPTEGAIPPTRDRPGAPNALAPMRGPVGMRTIALHGDIPPLVPPFRCRTTVSPFDL